MMKKNILKITLVLFLLFLGTVKTNAACNGDCLFHVFQLELDKKDSKEVFDYFLNKSKEDCNIAYLAWEVLYKTDTSVDRLDTNNLEEIIGYIKRSENELDVIIKNINDAGGYVSFKSTPSWFVSFVDEPYKKVLKEDLEASEELVKLFHKKPEVIASWQKLVDYPYLRKDIEILKTYGNLKRIGNYSNTVKPVRISELTKMHPTPKLGKEAEFESLINSLKNEGFNLQEPIIAVQLPDGTKLVMDGNHRLDATIKLCGEKSVADVKVITQEQAIKKYGEASFFKRVRSGEIQIQGNLPNEVLIKENADLIRQLGEENIVVSLKISKLSGFYKGLYKQPITRQGVTEEDLDAFSKSFMDQNFPSWESK